MQKCWLCNNAFESLSKEHIIPHFFGGIVYTENFSCLTCNNEIGKVEQTLNQLSILMHNLDNAHGEPITTGPIRGSRNKETKMSYGDNPTIQLSSTGYVESAGWQRPPGKLTSEDKIWLPGQIPLTLKKEHAHKSMLKAILALACHLGFQKDWFEVPLSYLAGNHSALGDVRLISLGIPPRDLFARVWIFAPPSSQTMTIYGAVIYGPISNTYTLCAGLEPNISPFCCELEAYSRKPTIRIGQENYEDWWSTLLKESILRDKPALSYRVGPYTVKHSRKTDLAVVEASPAALASGVPDLYVPIHPLEQTHGWLNRFETWARSVWSAERHTQFLTDAAHLDSANNQRWNRQK